MFKFFKKNKNKNNELLLKTASLLIHAAKIDENYTDIEKSIIEETLLSLNSANSNIKSFILLFKKTQKI